MKKAWHVWSLFLLCLLAVAIVMAWLSLKTIHLDAQRESDKAETELARREAELQELISSALYRMDLKMLPLVAQESARPPEFYRPFYEVLPPPTSAESQTPARAIEKLRLASPLLLEPSDWVQLHFEIDASNRICSPRLPQDKEREEARANFRIPETVFAEAREKVASAAKRFDYTTLVQKTLLTGSTDPRDLLAFSNPVAGNYFVPAVEKFRNSVREQSSALASGNNIRALQQSRSAQRLNDGFNRRRDSTQEFTNQTVENNGFGALGYNSLPANGAATNDRAPASPSHPMQPIWLGEQLLMARPATNGERSVIQCCWLDWEEIKSGLQKEVADLLPELEFEAVTADTELKIGTALTTIPVQLVIDRSQMLSRLAVDSPEVAGKPAFSIPLLTAWGCFAIAALASALLLHGVMRLSERRAAFVSAVTHELRTPLTTFRMYSEMLAEGMVPPKKQQQYASTMKVQADRLSHLVENVLQFARLERGPSKIVEESMTIGGLLDRFRSRMEERATDSQMRLVIELDESTAQQSLLTQPAAIEQILFNLVDNACKYAHGASDNRIVVSAEQSGRRICFHVRDFGPGISDADRKRIFEPFQQSAIATENAISGVGLGLALCSRMARSMNGRLLDRRCEKGAWFELELPFVAGNSNTSFNE